MIVVRQRPLWGLEDADLPGGDEMAREVHPRQGIEKGEIADAD